MTPEQIVELRAYISGDALLKAMAIAGQDNDIVEEIYNRTAVITQQPYMIGQRGIVSTVGLVAGHKFLIDLKTFSEETLVEGHPLADYQAPIGSLLAWLYQDGGLDIGDSETRVNLDGLVAAEKIDANITAAIKAKAEKTVSIPEAKGWGGVSHMDVAKAVRDRNGNLLV